MNIHIYIRCSIPLCFDIKRPLNVTFKKKKPHLVHAKKGLWQRASLTVENTRKPKPRRSSIECIPFVCMRKRKL